MSVNICINLHLLFGLLLDAQSKFSKHANGFVAHCIFEIPGPQQKAGAAHELNPLSIPPVASGNLQDPVFVPGSLGLTRNIGFSNFYRRFIYGYSEITVLLMQLTQKDVLWDFSDDC